MNRTPSLCFLSLSKPSAVHERLAAKLRRTLAPPGFEAGSVPPKRPRVPRRSVTDDNPGGAFHAITGTAQALADHEPISAFHPVKGTADSLLAPPLRSAGVWQAVKGTAEALLTMSWSAKLMLSDGF